MTPEKIQSIVENAIGQQFENYWVYLLLSILLALISSYLLQYFKEKGKNLATQEVIEKITSQVESVKHSYKIDFDKIQKNNDLIFSEIKDTKNRYNSKQFELYNELWRSLIELKLSADELWDSATKVKLHDFSKKVHSASVSLEKSAILIDDNHYIKLRNILNEFEGFKFGKSELLLKRLRYKTKTQLESIDFYNSIEENIQRNGIIKNNYDNLLDELKNQFKIKVRGEDI